LHGQDLIVAFRQNGLPGEAGHEGLKLVESRIQAHICRRLLPIRIYRTAQTAAMSAGVDGTLTWWVAIFI
jgi:hypothetical protein